MLELTHPDDLAHSREVFESELSATESVVSIERRYLTKSGGSVWASTTATILRDDEGDVIGSVVIVEDLTDRKHSVARDVAVEASRVKSQFLANMSHEILTPMNGVLGMAQLLIDTELDSTQQSYLDVLRDSGENLLLIINDIMDFSKVEAGKLELESEEFDLPSTVERLIALLTPTANNKGLSLELAIAEDVARRVIGDPTRIRQVLTNLVDNAIKFTDAGRVDVKVSASPDGQVRFEVTDTGIGIDTSGCDLFEAFSQADASTTRRFGGAGLGLAICHQLVDLMSGTLAYTGELGVGSTFWFEVPLALCPAPCPHGAARLATTEVPTHPGAVARVSPDHSRVLVS